MEQCTDSDRQAWYWKRNSEGESLAVTEKHIAVKQELAKVNIWLRLLRWRTVFRCYQGNFNRGIGYEVVLFEFPINPSVLILLGASSMSLLY